MDCLRANGGGVGMSGEAKLTIKTPESSDKLDLVEYRKTYEKAFGIQSFEETMALINYARSLINPLHEAFREKSVVYTGTDDFSNSGLFIGITVFIPFPYKVREKIVNQLLYEFQRGLSDKK